MKVLLLHPEDRIPPGEPSSWNLIVDLARAPQTTYAAWRNRFGCEVISIYEFAEEIDDLECLRKLLQTGIGELRDGCGIDWWDVLGLELIGDLHRELLARRLASRLSPVCQLYASRPHAMALSVQNRLGVRLINLQSGIYSSIQRLQHFCQQCSNLDSRQLLQIAEDKFGAFRMPVGAEADRSKSDRPTILCPSAYLNASRTVLAFAGRMPHTQFSLVYTRRSGKIYPLPSNVHQVPLAPYHIVPDRNELAMLLSSWDTLHKRLIGANDVFRNADSAGMLSRIPALLQWGISLRDAWRGIFQSREFVGCLCTDDSNPPTRIPLILAKNKGLPCVVAHHGALDYAMAFKQHVADLYLAKSEMERDYLLHRCRVAAEKVELHAGVDSELPEPRRSALRQLVFFTEPYQNFGRRRDEVYRELVPPLCHLARRMNLALVFKLHPFESERGFRKMLKRCAEDLHREVCVTSGAITNDLWRSTKVALTVQSSVAMECRNRNIPVILCTWLRDPLSGYAGQFAKFGVGLSLTSPEEIGDIPQLLENYDDNSPVRGARAGSIRPLTELFCADPCPEYAVN